jgi:TPR repeat protein
LESSNLWVRRVEKLVEEGAVEAAIHLASGYRRGLGDGTPEERHIMKARRMLELAAENGYVHCAEQLMEDHLHGLNGAEASSEKFEYWARKAAGFGSGAAQKALDKLAEQDRGDPRPSDG